MKRGGFDSRQILSAGGEVQKGLDAITKQLPNLKNSVSLLDRKHQNSAQNPEKIEGFIAAVRESV